MTLAGVTVGVAGSVEAGGDSIGAGGGLGRACRWCQPNALHVPPASCVHQVLSLFRTLQAISHLQMGGYDPAPSLPTLSRPCLGKLATPVGYDECLGKLATPVGSGTWLDLVLIGIGWCHCWTGRFCWGWW